ncbi:Major facilitator superfamily domain, general substrate transporter [Akanthomyces lecanii RCEF 1005]|uniref:Major facilitator superfamily domain, general substrate transporter n=1 Tax=Akanthomyces lecanii RCEF 1005 TaxID=1081108 RepID=A0A168FT20_CORDF|nr:Major facilitator superfamily domain, general substrate transporter [Akanthomyces lecanii RCEF 1005]
MSSSDPSMDDEKPSGHGGRWGLGRLFGRGSAANDSDKEHPRTSKWSMGVLNDPDTVEVPGSVLLLAAHRNEPLGLRNMNARNSHSSIPTGFPVDMPMTPGGTRPMPVPGTPGKKSPLPPEEEKKTTDNGEIILDPQPDDSVNDPLNWPSWRRDTALLTLGFYCMLGGGVTPIIAAGFTDVAQAYHVEAETVALTTGLYMMGLGVGSVFASPTAILFGKRPVYLASAVLFIGTSLWAGWSPSFASLIAARVFQGIAVSPVECLPSATIAEIFFLHERAFRIGIYTLLLLGGKNLVPLVSAAIIGRFGWRWVFWIMAMIVGVAGVLLFLFVPETFWDRTPTRKTSNRPSFFRRLSSRYGPHKTPVPAPRISSERPHSPGAENRHHDLHVGFAPDSEHHAGESPGESPSHVHNKNLHVGFNDASEMEKQLDNRSPPESQQPTQPSITVSKPQKAAASSQPDADESLAISPASPSMSRQNAQDSSRLQTPNGRNSIGNSSSNDYFSGRNTADRESISSARLSAPPKIRQYTHNLRQQPAQSFVQQLKPYHGRLNGDKWHKVLLRPFVLFAYPAVLWSAVVYACSIGWLIVISETMAIIYRNPETYNFTALQTGLVYISPFVGGILGTGVAGKISDIIVKAMARRNGGLYEPEFRLVMAIPILITTCIGLMGFGWSAQIHNHWIVPTLFFGVVSFGCSLGSTTSITFCVDSYRQYAGEALVTLNFSKNVLHGLVFSLFFSHWLADDGPKMVYIWIGIIQLILLLWTVPLFIYGKRLRMWTVRKNFMEKL